MATKKVKRGVKKATYNKKPARKRAALREKVASSGTRDSIVEAARRRWLSAEGSETSRVVSLSVSVRRRNFIGPR
jgi:hypothetical protein